MQQLLPPGLKMKLTRTVNLQIDGIRAFCEKPSPNSMQKKEEPAHVNNEINASELFSLFTANIIKDKIIFTR
ncbi:hypothetical protein FW778_13485 [Ginsengibacter hankyongi]|uniref:Uncharacterized protein n=1 Tax=Ginsengibacter hankyongi TaxID=2607284 RepID=A0A5J5IH48_9BACT|nr:hypothetical protein [Ginsengibacter hankyongi]KAA9038566.1 hypothetical protein FW778_13485 [Ginsengibacter hankyongi]